VFTLEGEISVPAMIETSPLPAAFAMAGITLFPVAPRVPVVVAVAAVTVFPGFFPGRRLLVAGFAADRLMLSF
jgi:hypothetical protein